MEPFDFRSKTESIRRKLIASFEDVISVQKYQPFEESRELRLKIGFVRPRLILTAAQQNQQRIVHGLGQGQFLKLQHQASTHSGAGERVTHNINIFEVKRKRETEKRTTRYVKHIKHDKKSI